MPASHHSVTLQSLCHELQYSTWLTRGTCDNIGGYFVSDAIVSGGTTTAATVRADFCYYDTFDCPGYSYHSQCYSNRSSEMSCPTCNNIGGLFAANYGCYYYVNDCSRYLSAGQQCHTNRCCKHVAVVLCRCMPLLAASLYRINRALCGCWCIHVAYSPSVGLFVGVSVYLSGWCIVAKQLTGSGCRGII